MRITLRLIVALVVTVAVVAAFSAYFQVQQESARLKDEMERRSRLLAESLQESVQPVLQQGSSTNLQRLVEKFGNRERVVGMAVYDAKENVLAVTEKLSLNSSPVPSLVAGALKQGIARALVTMDENLKKDIKKAGFLTRDARMRERKKYGRKRARRRFQFTKR